MESRRWPASTIKFAVEAADAVEVEEEEGVEAAAAAAVEASTSADEDRMKAAMFSLRAVFRAIAPPSETLVLRTETTRPRKKR